MCCDGAIMAFNSVYSVLLYLCSCSTSRKLRAFLHATCIQWPLRSHCMRCLNLSMGQFFMRSVISMMELVLSVRTCKWHHVSLHLYQSFSKHWHVQLSPTLTSAQSSIRIRTRCFLLHVLLRNLAPSVYGPDIDCVFSNNSSRSTVRLRCGQFDARII